MEQTNLESDISQYEDITKIKKLYNRISNTNLFLNQYTLPDIEEAKPKLIEYFRKKDPYITAGHIQSFVDETARRLTCDLFGDMNNTQMIGVGNLIQDSRTLNPDDFKKLHRLINIDSTYRKNLWGSDETYDSTVSTNMTIKLNDTLDNVISLEMTSVSIPYTFYSIDSTYGNNYFYIEDTSSSEIVKIEIDGANYTISSLISAIQDVIDIQYEDILTISVDSLSYKTTITNVSDDITYNFIFYDHEDGISESKVNNNLGWILGFRQPTFDDNGNDVSIEYSIGPSDSIISESICFIPHTKYFIVTIEDNNKEQTNKGLVQIGDDITFIKQTQYFKNSAIQGRETCLDDSNIQTFIDTNANPVNNLYNNLVTVGTNVIGDTLTETLATATTSTLTGNDSTAEIEQVITNTTNDALDIFTTNETTQLIGGVVTNLQRVSALRNSVTENLTKNQIYSSLQIKKSKTKNVAINQNNINTNTISDVFAVIPFEDKSLTWGQTTFTSDKNRFKRNYTKPVNIDKLTIKLLDDRGNIVNLNGTEWSFSMMSTHLYER